MNDLQLLGGRIGLIEKIFGSTKQWMKKYSEENIKLLMHK